MVFQAICFVLFAAAAAAASASPCGSCNSAALEPYVPSCGSSYPANCDENVYPSYPAYENVAPTCGSFASSPVGSVPAPRTISNRCKCVKTIVRPQLVKQLIEVPVTRQYIETYNKPIVQKVTYSAKPQNNYPVYEAPVYQGPVYESPVVSSGCSDGYQGYPAPVCQSPVVSSGCSDGCQGYPSQYETSYGSCPVNSAPCGCL